MAVYRISKDGKPISFIKESLRNYDHQSSFFMMLAINLVPVAGVLFFGWNAYQVFGLYMLESFIIGLFNVLKLFVVDFNGNKPGNDETGAAIGFINIPFFILHFNFFLAVQFILFNSFITIYNSNSHSAFDLIYYAKNLVNQIPAIAIGGIILNQLYSFTSDFMVSGKYKIVTPGRLLFQPYPRVFVQQLVVILGGFITIPFGFAPKIFIVLFCGVKIFFDVIIHLNQFNLQGKQVDGSITKELTSPDPNL